MQAGESIKAHTYKFVILVSLSLALLVADYQSGLNQLRTSLSIVAFPLQFIVDYPSRLRSGITEYFSSRHSLIEDNKELNRLLMVYSAKDQSYRSLSDENARLRELLDVSRKMEQKYMFAHVLNLENERFSRTSTINKGSQQGVYDGQVALSGSGIYGQIVSSSSFSSVVMQLTDPLHTIPVKNARTGMTALAVGAGKSNTVRLTSIEEIADVNTGDLYLSSGLGRVFPPDFPVARVREKHYNPADSMTVVLANTLTDYPRVKELLLTWPTEAINNPSPQPTRQGQN